MSIEVMKQALEALETSEDLRGQTLKTIASLQLAIEQAERDPHPGSTDEYEAWLLPDGRPEPEQAEKQEPVDGDAYDMIDRFLRNNLDDHYYAEYSAALDRVAAPPQRQPLTEQEIMDAWKQVYEPGHRLHVLANSLARAIERKHGIGGGE